MRSRKRNLLAILVLLLFVIGIILLIIFSKIGNLSLGKRLLGLALGGLNLIIGLIIIAYESKHY